MRANNDRKFNNEVYRSRYRNQLQEALMIWLTLPQYRVKDWLYGVRAAQPDREAYNSLAEQSMTEAERYRVIYHMITGPREEGGAGITPKKGQWKNVESIFPLHDHNFNKAWIKKWSMTTFLKAEDLDEIRDRLGEKVIQSDVM